MDIDRIRLRYFICTCLIGCSGDTTVLFYFQRGVVLSSTQKLLGTGESRVKEYTAIH